MAKQPSWSKEDFPQEDTSNDKIEELRKFIKENIRIEISGLRHSENSICVALSMKDSKGIFREFSSDSMTF